MREPENNLPLLAAGQLGRRRMLQAGGAACLGLNLMASLRSMAAESASGAATSPKTGIRSCIFVFYYGGPSHLDTLDMKPEAPSEVRGEFKSAATNVPGLRICEHLPNLSRVMSKVAVIRSMHHTNRLHDSASIETFTGRQGPQGDREEFAPIPQFFPCSGASLHYLRQHLKHDVHHAILPWLIHNVIDVPCQGGGFLGRMFDPFPIGGDPKSQGYRSAMLHWPNHLTNQLVGSRRRLLQSLQDRAERKVRTPQSVQFRELSERAFELLQSKSLREAMAIEKESPRTRERYGVYGESASRLRGQNLLLARRLVEAGVPFINVNDFRQQGQNWDSHSDNFNQHRKHLLPPADRALAALIEDLDERGLLDSTLVVATGEFGRTPKINANAGRDHWPDCYSLLLAGGGVQGGAVLGASDRIGAYPESDPVSPADLAATIFWRFGIDPATEIQDQTTRPHRLTSGRPLARLFV